MAKKKPIKEIDDKYHLTLQLGEKTFKSEGETIFDALRTLEKPSKIISKGILTLTKGQTMTQQMFMPPRLKRLFYSPIFQKIQAKSLEQVGLKPVRA